MAEPAVWVLILVIYQLHPPIPSHPNPGGPPSPGTLATPNTLQQTLTFEFASRELAQSAQSQILPLLNMTGSTARAVAQIFQRR